MAETVSYPELLAGRLAELRGELARLLAPGSDFVWEVGCGHGHFLNAYAGRHPERVCVGIDIASDRVARAERKRERAKLANLHFLRADASLFMEAIPPGCRCSSIFVLFPDPWPKARHNKHRLLQPGFLRAAAAHARVGARLYFRTDHAAYFAAAREVLRESPDWKLAEEAWPFEFETVFQQRAERHESLVAVRM